MGKYKNEGDAALALAEECAEVVQIITKMKRFGGNWDEIAPGKEKTRWEELRSEMGDLISQWERLKAEIEGYDSDYEGCEEDYSSYEYGEDVDVEMLLAPANPSPEYIVVSTSFELKETYVFEGNEQGEIVHWGEIVGTAERFGDKKWQSHEYAVSQMEGVYDKVKHICHNEYHHQTVWKKMG